MCWTLNGLDPSIIARRCWALASWKKRDKKKMTRRSKGQKGVVLNFLGRPVSAKIWDDFLLGKVFKVLPFLHLQRHLQLRSFFQD